MIIKRLNRLDYCYPQLFFVIVILIVIPIVILIVILIVMLIFTVIVRINLTSL